MKLVGALLATLLVFGLVFGVGQAAAASLPGEPLYGLKLTAEQARLELTSDPEAKADLTAELAENRLGEIAQMMAEGKAVDGPTAHAAQQQVSLAFQAANQVSGDEQLKFQARNRLQNVIQSQHQMMASAVDAAPQQTQEPVRSLLRSMERVRDELHTGEGEASGQQIRTNRDQVPDPTGPVGEPGVGAQAGQAEGDGLLLDATGTGTENGQPNNEAQFGPGPELQDGSQGPYEGEAPSYGPGPADDEAPAGLQWLWQLFRKDSSSSGSGSSGGTSGSGSSGGTSGSGNSGGSSGSGSSGNRP
jgi:uncharacterized membrane protein YgcG